MIHVTCNLKLRGFITDVISDILDADVEITFFHGDDEASCFLKIDSNPIEVEAQL